jgi:hypothetical protein
MSSENLRSTVCMETSEARFGSPPNLRSKSGGRQPTLMHQGSGPGIQDAFDATDASAEMYHQDREAIF